MLMLGFTYCGWLFVLWFGGLFVLFERFTLFVVRWLLGLISSSDVCFGAYFYV